MPPRPPSKHPLPVAVSGLLGMEGVRPDSPCGQPRSTLTLGGERGIEGGAHGGRPGRLGSDGRGDLARYGRGWSRC